MTYLIVGYVAGYVDVFPCVAEISLINSSLSNLYECDMKDIINRMNAKYYTNEYSIKNIIGKSTIPISHIEQCKYDNIKKFIPHKLLVLETDVIFDEDIRSCLTTSLIFYRNYDIAHNLAFGMSSGIIPVMVHTYYDNGSIESYGSYIYGVKHGLMSYYDTFGNIIDTVKYNMGIIKRDKDVDSLTRFIETYKML
jgi:antitoxin component YwqK of YwqJK toxin-antitoxin module